MALFSKDKLQGAKMVDPKETFANLLASMSGTKYGRELKYNIFYRIIGFMGASTGVGCSTIVANTALALADLGLTVCVFETSVLHPTIDTLLKTSVIKQERKERKDWYDLPFSRESVLHVSGRNRNISVLSFYGRGRTALDMLSASDSATLVEESIKQIEGKFDVVLIDLCDELTRVNFYACQKAQHIIQVWDDSLNSIANLDAHITNLVTLSCPMDKMRYVVENRMHDDVIGNLDALYSEYRFKKLAHCVNSTEISRLCSINHKIWQYPTNDEGIIMFNNMIIDIIKHICNIVDEKEEEVGKLTTEAILAGEVEGTVHQKLKLQKEEFEGGMVTTPDLNESGGNDWFAQAKSKKNKEFSTDDEDDFEYDDNAKEDGFADDDEFFGVEDDEASQDDWSDEQEIEEEWSDEEVIEEDLSNSSIGVDDEGHYIYSEPPENSYAGYYDDDNNWVELTEKDGYYDENGEWVWSDTEESLEEVQYDEIDDWEDDEEENNGYQKGFVPVDTPVEQTKKKRGFRKGGKK